MSDPGPSILAPAASSTTTTCALCSNPSKYTCPRCSIKTCSLPCSKSHKSSTGCTGERDKAAYVPMNAYGWGTLADDYTYLEDVGRSIGNWGRDIRGLGKGGGRGGKGKGRGQPLTPKCEALRVQLAARDIRIQFVADGMEKRRLNQSSWDVRTKTVYLTVEFIFHVHADKSDTGKPSTVTILTHRNNLSTPLLTSLTSHLKHKSDVPSSILELMGISRTKPLGDDSERKADTDSPAAPPNLLFTFAQLEKPSPQSVPTKYQAPALPIHIGPAQPPAPASSVPPQPKPRKVFYPLDSTSSLQTCLRNRSFIEWPTIDIFPSRAAFEAARVGDLAEGATAAAERDTLEEPASKRRKTETGLVQLVGGYGEESESDAGPPGDNHGIGGLGGYESDGIDEGFGESIGSQSS